MSDNYPRVSAWGEDQPLRYERDSAGSHKVVPRDAIVIEHSELPEVTAVDNGTACTVVNGIRFFAYDDSPEALRAMAAGQLALAEYLTAHQQVDEAQVAALNSLMVQAVREGVVEINGDIEFERFLVRKGVHTDIPKEQP